MKAVVTVPKLLSALLMLGSVTFGFFAWDFERAINRLDAIDRAQAAMTTTQTVTTTRVDGLTTRVDGLSSEVVDHEKRITVIEARQQ